jgi:RNA polymerase sigma factor (sigma-70 family)
MQSTTHPDQKYITALLHNDSKILRELYQKFSGKVVSFIVKNNGDRERAQDVIQEVLVTIYHQAKEKGLVLTAPFDAYFFLLCKRKWLNEIQKFSHSKVTNLDENVSILDDSESMVQETEKYERQSGLYQSMFDKMSEACRELLEKTLVIKSLEEVARIMQLSYAYVRKKKSECMGKLTQMIQNHPEYQSLKN